jgi:uncharacterized protein
MKKITLALLLAIGANSAYAEAPKPLMWKVSDADNSLYLLGSFHMLKKTDYPLAKSTDAAFDDAEQVYFELSPAEMNDAATLGQKMAKAGMYADGKTLEKSISEETWKKFVAYVEKRKLPSANFQPVEPWFAGLMLSVIEMQLMGLKPEEGLDKHFMDRAAKANKPTFGLETGDSQIAVFDSMSSKAQEENLLDLLDSENPMAELEALHTAWRNGDEKAIEKLVVTDMREQYAEYYEGLLVKRNKAWVPTLEGLLKDNKKDDVLVVVGAGHLVGDEGVITLLEGKGYKIERVN